MIVVELLAFVIPMLTGIALVSAARIFNEKVVLTAVGSLVGLALFITITYLVTVVAPLTALTLAILLALAAALFFGLVTYTSAGDAWRVASTDRVGVMIALLVIGVAALIAPKLLMVENGSLSTGVLNAWGDVAWHMANITNFADGQSIPPENPIYAGTRLTYPFLVNFFSGMLLKLGASYSSSVNLPAGMLMTLTFVLFYCLGRNATGQRTAGVVAVILLLCTGGVLGWTRLSADLAQSGQPIGEFLLHLPRDYTGSGGDPDGFHFLNPILSLLLPQRSFLLGMPLAFGILLLLLAANPTQTTPYLYAGILAGLLPLFHGHTVLALVPAIIALFAIQFFSAWRTHRQAGVTLAFPLITYFQGWILFVLLAGIVGVPEMLYYVSGSSESGSFFRFGPRWTAGEENIIWFWLKNTGLLIPLTVVGLFVPSKPAAKALGVAGLALLVIANLYLFAPWAWDNFKLLIFWLLFSLPVVGSVAAWAWSGRSPLGKAVVVLLIAAHAITGGIDLLKTALPTATAWGEWDADAIALASKIRQHVPAGESVLTAPYHNTPVALAGRRMYLGFPGHVWSHGGNHWQREQAVPGFYQGTLPTLPELQPRFVVVSPVERGRYPGLTIRPEWTLVAREGASELYALPQPATP